MMEWLWRTWLARDEYRLFDDDARWRAALLTARRRISNHWAFWLFWLFAVPGVLNAATGFTLSLPIVGSVVRPLAGLASGIVLFCTVMVGVALVCRRIVRHHLRAALWAAGRRICMRCGYDLRGQTVPRCPECGQSLEASAAQVQVRPTLRWRVVEWVWARGLARREYALLAGRADRALVLKRAQREALEHWSIWLAWGVVILIYCSGVGGSVILLMLMEYLPRGWALYVTYLLPPVLVAAYTVLSVRRRVRRALRSVLDRPVQ